MYRKVKNTLMMMSDELEIKQNIVVGGAAGT